jgi:hypothetical protein
MNTGLALNLLLFSCLTKFQLRSQELLKFSHLVPTLNSKMLSSNSFYVPFVEGNLHKPEFETTAAKASKAAWKSRAITYYMGSSTSFLLLLLSSTLPPFSALSLLSSLPSSYPFSLLFLPLLSSPLPRSTILSKLTLPSPSPLSLLSLLSILPPTPSETSDLYEILVDVVRTKPKAIASFEELYEENEEECILKLTNGRTDLIIIHADEKEAEESLKSAGKEGGGRREEEKERSR